MITLLKTFYAMLLGKEGANSRKAAIVILALLFGFVLIFSIAVYRFFAPSKLESQIEDRKPEIVNSQVDTGVKTEEVNRAGQTSSQAEKRSTEAQRRVSEARNTNTTNTNYSTANAERCKAYPESEDCR